MPIWRKILCLYYKQYGLYSGTLGHLDPGNRPKAGSLVRHCKASVVIPEFSGVIDSQLILRVF